MRTEEQMLSLILNIAKCDERIRAVYINGSRANPNVKKDIFQDYDIIYVVTEIESFTKNNDWIKVFGEILIMQLPDEMDKIVGLPVDLKNHYAYLMQFADGNRIDLGLSTIDYAINDCQNERMTIILLDKDNLLPKMDASTDSDYWVKKPTAELYYRCWNEFWWVILYAGKGLWRKEVLYALDHVNNYIRPELYQMISWYVGINTNFSCSIGKCGKYLKRYLSSDIWKRFLLTYSTAEIDEIWKSIFTMADLFLEMALIISQQFNYQCDIKEAHRCIRYLQHIKDLPADVLSIF